VGATEVDPVTRTAVPQSAESSPQAAASVSDRRDGIFGE
jgi:hypothetical protein